MINDLSIWIDVTDIRKWFPVVSPNTSAEQLNPYILASETLDLTAILDDTLIEDIDEMILSPSLIKPELNELFNMVIKPFLSGCTMQRYLPYMGLNATQWAFEEYTQEGFKPITDKRRAEIVNSIEGTKNTYQVKLLKYLQDAKYTFDGVVYPSKLCKQTKPRLSFTVIGAGNTNRLHNDRYHNGHERLY